ncbi:MAG: hypothetical protein GDA68_07400 [Nitrospira sp. CR2.1]|nr:hypothetical protein [Nitrospira sp. CR2.1]
MITRRMLLKILAAAGGGSLFPSSGEAVAEQYFRVSAATRSGPLARPCDSSGGSPQAHDVTAIERWENLLDDLDAVELIGRYVSLKPALDDGSRLTGRCPFCRQGTSSLLIDARDDSYFCTDCLVGGHALDFHARIEGVDLVESVRLVRVFLESGQLRGKRPRMEVLWGMMEATVELAHQALVLDCEGRAALAWLAQEGITEATIDGFSLGLMSCGVGRRLRDHLLATGFDGKQLDDAGVTGWLDCREDHMRNGESDATILMPVRDGDGRCCGFYEQAVGEFGRFESASSYLPYGFRLLSPHRADRLVFSEPSASTQSDPASSVILTERPWDVLLLAQKGIDAMVYVAPLAMDVCHERFARFLARTSRVVWPIHRSDFTAGFLKEMARLPGESLGKLAFMMLPEGTSFLELVRREEPHAVRQRLAHARSINELIGPSFLRR